MSTAAALPVVKKNTTQVICIGTHNNQANRFLKNFEKTTEAAVEVAIDGQRGPNKEWLKIGFKGANGFVSAYNVCFITLTRTPIYQSIERKMKSSVKVREGSKETTRINYFYASGYPVEKPRNLGNYINVQNLIEAIWCRLQMEFT
jgi:hypothetical protein